jgi:hypothetical protein
MNASKGWNGIAKLPMSGTEINLLLSATYMLVGWIFERSTARAMITREECNKIRVVNDHVSHEWKRILESADAYISPATPWTREFIEKRAATRGEIHLTAEQLHLSVLALRVSHEEFATNWDEFCVASPGGIEWYGVAPSDLLTLANKLESLLLEVGE